MEPTFAKNIKVKTIYDIQKGLEDNINTWLAKYPDTLVIDIKFGHGGTYSSSTSEALIIYQDDGKIRF